MVIVLTAVTLVCTAALAGINEVTKATIEANAKANLHSSILIALGWETATDLFPEDGSKPKLSPHDIEEQYFATRIQEVKRRDGLRYWRAYKDKIGGELEAYVIRITGGGFQGLVAMQAAIKPDFQEISGAHVIKFEIGETPGLGYRMTEEKFWGQFAAVQTEPQIEFIKYVEKAEHPNQFVAITGATYTSTTVRDLLNKAIAQLKQAESGAKPK